MRKCPNCDKTFDDSMRFCQTDGTPLVDVVEEVADDALKTTVVRQEDFASAIPPETPFESSAPVKEDSGDLLQLPEEYDPMKTMVAPNESNFDLNLNESKAETPVSQVEEKVEEVSALAPEPPKFSEPSLSPPNFGDMSPSSSLPVAETPKVDDEPPPTAIYMPESSPFSTPPTPQSPVSPFDNVNSSPFDRPMEKPQDAPIPSPFDTPPPVIPSFQEPQPIPQSNPFEQPSGFGGMQQQNQGFNQPVQQSDWTPPPAPNASWQDQGLGANTPFQPPAAGVGQDQTLAIVSLVCGVLGICLCGLFTGIPAIITGFMAKNKADANPAQFGGRGMALAGIILGFVSIVLTIIGVIIQLGMR